MRLLHIRPLQSTHNRQPQVHLLNNIDQTLRDGITPHDTAENVDKDGSDFGIRSDELESTLDGFRCGTSTNV